MAAGHRRGARARGREPTPRRSCAKCTGHPGAASALNVEETMSRSHLCTAIGLALASVSSFAASGTAGAYPDHAIRLIVPYPPGGNIDITARTIAPGMTEALGAQIVVDNRG